MPLSDKARASVWKAESKFFMANERTLIAWLRLATTIGVGAFLGYIASDGKPGSQSHGWGGVKLAVGALIPVYALVMYHRRIALVRARHMGTFEEKFGPAAVAFVIAVSLVLDLGYLLRQPAVGCLELPVPVFRNATPPYLYVSFHGTSHPRLGCDDGIGGLHRFTLQGHYAGPATDQLAAQMLQPRGMVRQDGLLFVADSWIGDSSVVVYGPCAGTSARTYLGRIRPDGAIAAAFGHPYGLASEGDGKELRLSAQNGGAIIAIDPQSNAMHVEHQVERLPGKRPADKSGPLRGLAIDSRGCQHVADKRADKVWHYCPDAAPSGTHVTKPISLFFEPTASRLYVSSLGGSGEVLALDLTVRVCNGEVTAR